MGIHAAIDTFKDWPAGAEVIGATFAGHPFVPTGSWGVKIEAPGDPLTRFFDGKGFVIHDEIYEMGEPFSRSDRRVLLTLDLRIRKSPRWCAASPVRSRCIARIGTSRSLG